MRVIPFVLVAAVLSAAAGACNLYIGDGSDHRGGGPTGKGGGGGGGGGSGCGGCIEGEPDAGVYLPDGSLEFDGGIYSLDAWPAPDATGGGGGGGGGGAPDASCGSGH
jgi:hypothetical protein